MIDVTFGGVRTQPEFAVLREYMEAKYGKPTPIVEEGDNE